MDRVVGCRGRRKPGRDRAIAITITSIARQRGPGRRKSNLEQAAQREEQEWLLLGQLEELLKQLDSSFSPRRYGCNTLSALVQENATLFATRRRAAKGRPIEIGLLCEKMVAPAAE